MWILFMPVPRPDAPYWPGRRWLAALDAVAWPATWALVVAQAPFTMGIVGVLQTLPDLLFGLPAGALADRWDRRRMILWADLGRALPMEKRWTNWSSSKMFYPWANLRAARPMPGSVT